MNIILWLVILCGRLENGFSVRPPTIHLLVKAVARLEKITVNGIDADAKENFPFSCLCVRFSSIYNCLLFSLVWTGLERLEGCTVMSRFSTLLPISAPIQINAPPPPQSNVFLLISASTFILQHRSTIRIRVRINRGSPFNCSQTYGNAALPKKWSSSWVFQLILSMYVHNSFKRINSSSNFKFWTFGCFSKNKKAPCAE